VDTSGDGAVDAEEFERFLNTDALAQGERPLCVGSGARTDIAM
jgi:hypothetical protein